MQEKSKSGWSNKGIESARSGRRARGGSWVIIFLSGSNASYVTGTGLVIDAGRTLRVHLT